MKAKVFFIIIVAVVVGLYCGLAVPTIKHGDNNYSGKVIFYNEQDYKDFKLALIESKATWSNDNIQILNNEPPIIVQFSADVPQNYDFKYGKIIQTWRTDMAGGIALLVSVIFLFYMGIGACMGYSTDLIKWSWLFTRDTVIDN
jgi:hypothetical protein